VSERPITQVKVSKFRRRTAPPDGRFFTDAVLLRVGIGFATRPRAFKLYQLVRAFSVGEALAISSARKSVVSKDPGEPPDWQFAGPTRAAAPRRGSSAARTP
jgi:hypothetical protein